MAVWNRHDKAEVANQEPYVEEGKDQYLADAHETKELSDGGHGQPANKLHRGLKSRHITMIAIGGAIGTGLIIGTGKALARAGPASILIAYTFVGLIVFAVMSALGEMAAWLPLGSGFSGYATRFCDPALGFALGYTYWFKYIIVTPNQLTAASLVIQYWVPATKLNPGVFITVFLVAIIILNYIGVKYFGEFEFVLSSIKVVVICALILLSLILALGGGPNHDRTGFRYWKNPGGFHAYIMTGSAGKFLGFWSSMVTAVFAYLGTELVGVTVGEAQNPRKTIPRAIKLTFYRILFFYVFSVFLLGMIVPYNSKDLAFAAKQSTSTASASPFVVAIQIAGIKSLPGVLNGCILLFIFSAANSDLYIAARTIYGLAVQGKAPAFLARTDRRGVPVYALGVSVVFCLLAYMNVSSDSKQVFNYFVNLVTQFGLLAWISILVTHIYFVKARIAQGVPETSLPYKAPAGIMGSYIALFFCILISLTKNFDVFIKSPKTYGNFDYKNFITGYLGIPLYLIMIFGYKLITKEKAPGPMGADLFTGKAEIDREEQEFLAEEAAKGDARAKNGKLYEKWLGWLL
ncbi:hypothetical protein BLS_000227 [Venturia inaequalis]|uniref:Amino acid permease/ SLC12A domain-containing protein n=1 Tax=Venturia inaequalis TaxID=5025 RepID=A0A8H3YJB6_VENIN|nr:hypothetical protein BLS_000227 [Venturia inaequalis]KAE9965610.1 hypothetical protein EG328_009518 [Venturia inaequalis]KAE9968896.1 hypothetical protein EG327_010881 [Venturia inaequalis]RDI86899.1 hypothetical protein Vi05172_g3279 [Venturia inaequalis]